MKVLVVANNKGGVAKTTTARMLCEWYSRRGDVRVLAIDLDPQCSLSLRLLEMDFDRSSEHGVVPPLHPADDDNDEPTRSSIADIWFGQSIVPYESALPGVDVAPGHGGKLSEVEYASMDDSRARIFDQLRKFLAYEDVRSAYDLVVIDTPPKKGQLSIAAVRAATHIVIPTVMEQQSIEGLQRMLLLLKRENMGRGDQAEARLAAIVPVMYRKATNLHQEFLEQLRSLAAISAHLPPAQIPNSIKVAETDLANARPKSILDLGGDVGKSAVGVCEFVHAQVFADA